MMRLISLTLLFLALTASAGAEEWPAWRGPRGDGTSREGNVPLHWGKGDNVAWKAPIPGIGHSSPVVWGDRVFLTSCVLEERTRVLLCLDRRDGKLLWQRLVVTSPLEPKHNLNSYASATPATDGRYVWTAFLRLRDKSNGDGPPMNLREGSPYPPNLVPEVLVTCWTVDGDKVWEKAVGRFYSRHGFCTTPTLYKDLVILNCDQDAEGYLVALEKAGGTERWRTERPNRTRSYCAPLIVEAAGRTQMVLSGSLCVASYDPDTGKQLWMVKGPTEQYVASPVYGEGVFFVTTGFPEYHNIAITPEGQVLWHEKKVPPRKASYVPSPLAYGKYFFVMSDQGYLSCFEAKTGKRLWMEQLGRHHSASPVEAEGRLYLPADEGVTYVVKAGPTFEVLARNDVGEECYGSPAVAHGQFFLRTLHHLYCIGSPAAAAGTRE